MSGDTRYHELRWNAESVTKKFQDYEKLTSSSYRRDLVFTPALYVEDARSFKNFGDLLAWPHERGSRQGEYEKRQA
jgi:hypothetical protein